MWSFPIYTIFTFPFRFCPFLPIRHLTRDIAPILHYIFLERFVIFRQFCHSHIACQIFALFPRLSYYQGHLSGILFNFPYLVIFWSDLPFSPFWSGFGIFYQIRYFTKKSLEPHFNLCQPFGDFSCQIHNFLPSWQVLSVSAGFVILVRLTLWPGTSHGVLSSFTISAFFNFSVRFCPFLPIRHLTRDIAPILHYIFLERFVIFRQFCHSHVACQIFALFPRLSYYQGHLSGILFNFPYLVIFWSDLPFSPFWSGFGIFYQIRYFTKKSLEPHFNLCQPFGDFSCQIHNFLPSWQVLSVSAGFVILVRLTLWPGTSHGVLSSFTISAFFNFSVRFCPFLPIRHLTRDIAPILHYIFLERFVIFRQFCHSHLPCQVFAVFSRLSFYHGYLSGILFNFRYLVIFWSDLPFSPFWSGFGIFFQIRYFTKKSFGASFQFASTLWWFFLPNSPSFHPPDRFSPFPQDSLF